MVRRDGGVVWVKRRRLHRRSDDAARETLLRRGRGLGRRVLGDDVVPDALLDMILWMIQWRMRRRREGLLLRCRRSPTVRVVRARVRPGGTGDVRGPAHVRRAGLLLGVAGGARGAVGGVVGRRHALVGLNEDVADVVGRDVDGICHARDAQQALGDGVRSRERDGTR